jgi:hypothetical protein
MQETEKQKKMLREMEKRAELDYLDSSLRQ